MLNENDDGEDDCKHIEDGDETDIDGESVDDEVEFIGNFL